MIRAYCMQGLVQVLFVYYCLKLAMIQVADFNSCKCFVYHAVMVLIRADFAVCVV